METTPRSPNPRLSRGLVRGVAPVAAASLLLSLTSAPAFADPNDDGPDHVEDGYTQPVFDYEDAVRERVMVEAPVDSDGDGENDLVRADIIRPADSGPDLQVPTIMVASPYFDNSGRGNEAEHKAYDDNGDPITFPLYYDNYFVPRGYAVVHVDMIGTTNSTGCPTTGGLSDVLSGQSVVEWLNGEGTAVDGEGSVVDADWSSGSTGMIGKSYDGTIANGVAATGVEGLETIVPIGAISTWYNYSRMNGLVNFDNYASYLAGVVDTDPPENCAHVRDAMDEAADDETGSYNEHWAERDYIDGTYADASQVEASVFVAHTVNDLNVKPDHFSLWWDELGANGVDRKLWLGQYAHVEPFDFRRDEWVDVLHRWFDHELYGVDNGVMDEPSADVQLGPDEWITEDTWPMRGPERTLRPAEDGSLGMPPARGGTDEFVDARMTEGEMVSDPLEDHPNRLAYVTGPLRTDMRLSGTPSVDLRVEVDQPEANLTALLVDYGETERVDYLHSEGGITTGEERDCHGESTEDDSACYLTTETRTNVEDVNVVARGWINGHHRDSLSDPNPLPVDEALSIEWDTLPQDYMFDEGHRMGLIIAGTDQDYVPAEDATGATVSVDLRNTSIAVPMRPFMPGRGNVNSSGSDFGPFDTDWTPPSDVELPVQPLELE